MRIRRWLALTVLLVLVPLGMGGPAAGVVRQVTDVKTVAAGPGSLDDAGTAVFSGASADPLGTNPEHAFQVFRFDPLTGAPVQVTSFAEGATPVLSVSDDGQWLAFASPADLTGENHDGSVELFRMAADGSSVAQLTSDPAPNAGSVSIVVLSGDAQRVAFVANTDPLGSNPGGLEQLFVVDADGTGLVQLTQATTGGFGGVSISDDGNRVVFAHSGDLAGANPDLGTELFAILADGSGLRQLTSSPAGFGSGSPSLSGNGATIAFQSNADLTGGNAANQDEIFVIGWDGLGLQQLTTTSLVLGLTGDPASQAPSITDDGTIVVFHSNNSELFPPLNLDGNFEIFRIASNGTGLTALTGSLFEFGSFLPSISGDGSRIAFYGIDLSNAALRVMDGGGGSELDLLTFDIVLHGTPDITPDGSRIVFTRSEGLLASGEIWTAETASGQPEPVTSFGSDAVSDPSIAGDGSTIVFSSDTNATGGNGDASEEIFRISVDGTGLAQLTSGPSGTSSGGAVIAAGGTAIVFASDADPLGSNADGSTELYRVLPDGSGLVQLTVGPADTTSGAARVDASGTWVAFESNADLDGSNPDGSYEIYRVRTDGTGLERIYGDASLDARRPDVSSDGRWITFGSAADPLGSNPEGNTELFAYDTLSATLSQLTSFTEGASGGGRIAGDGPWVTFSTSAPVFEDDPDRPSDLYRIRLDGTGIERVGARRAGFAVGIGPVSFGGGASLEPDDGGVRSALSGIGDLTAGNLDLLPEIWAIDRSTAAVLRVSGAAPTALSWDYEPGPVRYDAIRGDLAALAAGAGTVNLGAVVCLEDDSPDAGTAGFEDPEDPLPGGGFFYLYRGSAGLAAGPGSYGASSAGLERAAGAGDCTTAP